MTGFDHTDWTHANFAPYEPDTDGTEVQVEPLPFEEPSFAQSSFDEASFGVEPASLLGAGDGLESLSAWSTFTDGSADRQPAGDLLES